ncbi:hypothetical protein L195_g020990 [Trifolium pratense]|uniref:Uncharacterized protein n=4 Tax=Trifolium TaxID=3898 RepID=A0ACB0IZC2_TRIPR|nr:uncharacterized protein LOC123885205 [Trifolium pratense]PNX97757.1 hypothetical protein L195_g020990 [Trifolium pratense]CAJ2636972.1 unnamed protein product [Trifolium pratense]
MNHCGYQQKNAMRSCEEMRMESVVCPKPRRFGHMNNNHIRPFKPQFISYQSEIEDSKAREDLLDIILPKCDRFGDLMASSPPPYFCGSPPSRASNPVIQDEQFGKSNGHGNFSPFSMAAPSSPSSSARGCAPKKFGHTQAAVRIEGFDCLNSRDRRNCSISAVA